MYRGVRNADSSDILVIHQAPKEALSPLWESIRNGSPVMLRMSHLHNSVRGLTLGAQYIS
ncbi:DUF3764 family protein [Synechococcus sp. W2B2]|uniref:DUF3764 family protein n=1 Tax=unclassified Synechococcus TaxID=2626047 RepID=UPI0012EAA8EE